MGQVPRLSLLPCLGESAPDATLLPPLSDSGPCLALGAYLIGSSQQSVVGVRGPLATEGREVVPQPWVGQTSKDPSLERQRLGLLGIYLFANT